MPPRISISISRMCAANMYADRLVEFVNFLQKKRNLSHASFTRALQFTPHLRVRSGAN